jgi:hypothetical protein
MGHGYSYQSAIHASERVNWKVEDLIGGARRLDFSRPFMPEALARTEKMPHLGPAERLALNQIRGFEYLCVFGLVEKFILPFVVEHAGRHVDGDPLRTRAYLQFAAEEAKHIHLFERFREDFEGGFGTPVAVIGPPEAMAKAVLAHHPLAVALATLHIEWMTQRHYLDSVSDDQGLDPQFKSLLRHHWMEEAQHAKLDTLMVEALAEGLSGEVIDRAVDEYLEIGGLLERGLAQQAEFDVDALALAVGRTFEDGERAELVAAQRRSQRYTYLGSGMTHPRFLRTLGEIRPGARSRVESLAQAFA